MFEKNVLVEVGTTHRKFAEIFCADNDEMLVLDTNKYVAGTVCMSVENNHKEYRLNKPQGSWYDSSGAAVSGYNTDLGDITKTLTKLTATGDTKAYYGIAATVTLAPSTGYGLPETVTVAIGEATGVADTDYTYDDATGVIVIPAAKVTAAITITAAGVAESLGDITLTLANITSTGDTTATYEEDVDVTLAAAEEYTLPETITLSIGGVEKTVETDYTYDAETGAIHIDGAKVTGAVVIVADGVESGA
jgi:hypothetical protein